MPKPDEAQFDKRTVARAIQKGTITKKQYDSHMKNLPDCDEDSVEMEAELKRITHKLPDSPHSDEDEL